MFLFLVFTARSEMHTVIDGQEYTGVDLEDIFTTNKLNFDSISSLQIQTGKVSSEDVYLLQTMSNLSTLIVDRDVIWSGVTDTQMTSAFRTTLTHVELHCALTELSSSLFAGCSCVEVFVCPSLVVIGERAFEEFGQCDLLFPNLKQIGDFAFSYAKITSFEAPVLENLGNRTFYFCMDLHTVFAPAVGVIGEGCFEQCDQLFNVSVPNTAEIGVRSFYAAAALVELKLENIEAVPEMAFMYCVKLMKISIPNVHTICQYGFKVCPALTEFHHSKVEVIEKAAFQWCIFILSINCTAKRIMSDGFLGCIVLRTVILPKIEFLDNWCLSMCERLETISIDTNVVLGNYLFEANFALKRVSIPNAEVIGIGTFYSCQVLEEVVLTSLKRISEDTFNQAVIPHASFPSATRMDIRAFRGASITESLSLPVLEESDNIAFHNAFIGKLEAPKWRKAADNTFSQVTGLQELVLPELTTAGNYFIDNLPDLTNLSLPKLTDIGSYGFVLIKLEYLNLPCLESCESFLFYQSEINHTDVDSLVRVGDQGFAMSNVTSIALQLLEEAGDHCFDGNRELLDVKMEKLKGISHGMFCGCVKLERVSLPSVKTIGADGFVNCHSLREINFPYAVSIENNAFENCTSLASVQLPALAEFHGDFQFMNCRSLHSLNMQSLERVPVASLYIFSGCTSIKYIWLPEKPPSRFAPEVFKSIAHAVIVCLPSEDSYEEYTDQCRGESGCSSTTWNFLDMSVPENYEAVCGVTIEDEQNYPLVIGLSIGALVIAIGGLVTFIVLRYNKKRVALVKSRLELTSSVIDDFG